MKKKQYQRPTILVVKMENKENLMNQTQEPGARETLHRESEWEE